MARSQILAPLRICVVGCGKIADAHVEEIQNLPGVSLLGVCDREELMAEQLALRYKVPRFYSGLEEMLRAERPHVLHITTPPQSHLEIARKALAAGCHLFIEKPIAVNFKDTKALLDAVDQAGRKCTVGYFALFDRAALELRDLIRTGALGDLIHLESFYGYNLTGPYATSIIQDPTHWVHGLPGKLLQNVIDHLLNKIVELIPDQEIAVNATGFRRSKMARSDPSGMFFDELRIQLWGREVSGYATFSSHIRPLGHYLRVCGTKNVVTMDLTTSTLHWDRAPTIPSAIGRLFPPFQQASDYAKSGCRNVARFIRSDLHYFGGLNRLLSDYYESIRSDSMPPVPYGHILRVSAIMDTIFDQLRSAR